MGAARAASYAVAHFAPQKNGGLRRRFLLPWV